MSKFETQIAKAKQEYTEAQSKMNELTAKIDVAKSKLDAGKDISIDIENATLDDVHAHTCLLYTSDAADE